MKKHKIIAITRDLLTILSLIGVGGMVGGVIIIYALFWAFPEVWFLGSLILHIPDLRLILLSVLVILSGVMFVNKHWGVGCWKEYWKTKLVMASLLTYFAKYSFSVVGNFGVLMTLIFTGFMVWYISLLNEFLETIDLRNLWRGVVKNKRYWKEVMGLSLIIILLAGLIVLGIGKYRKMRSEENAWLSEHPQITTVEPSLVMPFGKVVIRGKHFDWQDSYPYKLEVKSNEGKVEMKVWTNEKIIIDVPWRWHNKKVSIWVEKERWWHNEKVIDKSDPVEIEVLNFDGLSEEKLINYYQMLENISQEARSLNEGGN